MAAAFLPLLPFIGQPFGTMKRLVVLEVTSSTSMRPLGIATGPEWPPPGG